MELQPVVGQIYDRMTGRVELIAVTSGKVGYRVITSAFPATIGREYVHEISVFRSRVRAGSWRLIPRDGLPEGF